MILADNIVASPGSRSDIYCLGGMTRLAGPLAVAPKFVLSRQSVGAVHSVSNSSPKSIMSARGFARSPYPTIWIEWLFRDVRETIEEPPEIPPGRYEPDKVGVMVETVPHDPLSGMMTLCWSADHRVEQSLLCQIYDLGKDAADLDAVMNHFDLPFRIGGDDREKLREDIEQNPSVLSRSIQTHIRRDRTQLDHLIDEMLRFDFVPNPRTIELFTKMSRSADRPDLAELTRDWEREALSTISALILLNSRNMIERREVSQARINKKRQARGKPKLQDHTVIRPGRGMGMPRGDSRSSGRAHVVRGHFKVRRGGVFWWNPHVRGDGKLRDRAAYEVKAS